MEIRLLNADEIRCRVGSVTAKGFSLLLYKDARCDMRILDEVFGTFGWQRTYEVINDNLFCNLSLWDGENKQWIVKQDVGTESNTEKKKGEASDSFKRACFNVGIGRELYTAPFIWIVTQPSDLDAKGKVKTKFFVKSISYTNREISELVIIDKTGVRFSYSSKKTKTTKEAPKEAPKEDYIQSIIEALDEQNDANFIEILLSIKEAETIADLTKISNTYNILLNDVRFKSSLTHRKNEIKAKQG